MLALVLNGENILGIEEKAAWSVLLIVLALIASGRFRMELVALVGLLVLGVSGFAPPDVIFSGFGHPALATIIAIFLVSQGIIDSGLLRGLGQALAKRVHSIRGQIISISAVSAFLSAFMNNVGAVGLMLPTAVRMAKRSGNSPGNFGMPLAIASILGGTVTLIGSAPNIIIASYMLSSTGQPFKMFDFTPHGLAMLITALLTWMLCKSCGMDPGNNVTPGISGRNKSKSERQSPGLVGDLGDTEKSTEEEGARLDKPINFAPLADRQKQATLLILLAAVLLVSLGLLHPAFGFGGAALLMIISGILKPTTAYNNVDLKIIFFLGAMLGIGQTLEHIGALDTLSAYIAGFTEGFSPFWLILLLVIISSALSNAINNSAAAVFMAPLAVGIAGGSSLGTAAALMAAAAGSNLTLLIPTHQAALMVMSKAPFSTISFLRFGVILSFFCSLAAAAVIIIFWQ